ncbi:MAG: tRNA (adenosine(37)-N6)-dimethylallyltransferase MiaA [Planctomycetes bacterium]|nr:tRNA (adenosine(37)-N6)-dimethylallyltransferase MiaA [Planctomycetota bacterium]
MRQKVMFIIGCTGSGKGSVARELAGRIGGEIISIDSMKVYRRMDIGTGKPAPELRRAIPHHLLDVVEPSEEFSVARYVELADQAIADIHQRGKAILIVGGTPLYIKALSEGLFEGPGADPAVRARLMETAQTQGREVLYARLQSVDPKTADRIHINDLRRIVRALEVYELTGQPISALQTQWDEKPGRFDSVFFGLRHAKEDQSRRINERVRRMIDAGLVDEVAALLAEIKPIGETARRALGYAEIIEHLKGRCTLADATEMIKINTRRFAKSQRTWFRRFSEVEWTDVAPDTTTGDLVDEIMGRKGSWWSA